jgi:hypothetical protein
MRRWLPLLLVGAALIFGATEARAQRPDVPSYLILQAPARTPEGKPYYPGRGYAVRPQAYAYGWFGAPPRSHWRRQEGYNSAYIQWSKQ